MNIKLVSKNWTAIDIFAIIIILSILCGYMYWIEYTEKRHNIKKMRTSEIFVLNKQAKQDIARQIESGAPISELDNSSYPKSGKFVSFIYISDSGEIVNFIESDGIFIIFIPRLHDGKVEWACYGQPQKYMPIECSKAL